MNISILIKKDAETIARLNEHVHMPHYQRQPAIFAPYVYEKVLEVVRELLAKENSYGLIAYRGEDPVGYAIVLRRNYPAAIFQPGHCSLFIDQMAVKTDCQGQGVGKMLIETVAGIARQEGIKRIELNVWTDNDGAKRLYERCGFKTYSHNMCREL